MDRKLFSYLSVSEHVTEDHFPEFFALFTHEVEDAPEQHGLLLVFKEFMWIFLQGHIKVLNSEHLFRPSVTAQSINDSKLGDLLRVGFQRRLELEPVLSQVRKKLECRVRDDVFGGEPLTPCSPVHNFLNPLDDSGERFLAPLQIPLDKFLVRHRHFIFRRNSGKRAGK